jgi:TM2 domain-containing membrane protein YozV
MKSDNPATGKPVTRILPAQLYALAILATLFVPGLGHLMIGRVNAGIQHFLCAAGPIGLGMWLIDTHRAGSALSIVGVVCILLGVLYWLVCLVTFFQYCRLLDAMRSGPSAPGRAEPPQSQ